MICLTDLTYRYPTRRGDRDTARRAALDGISLDIPSGCFMAVLGPNGSGKSTLARHLNALLLPSSGAALVDGLDTADAGCLWRIRDAVGMVFQNPDNQIVGTTVEEDAAFGPECRGLEPAEIRRRVTGSLGAMALADKRAAATSRLSGGEKQRAAAAGAVACLPSCLALDEPTAMLDPRARRELMALLHRLNRERGVTVVLITHHPDEAAGADVVALMERGRVLKRGTPAEVLGDAEAMRRAGMELPPAAELARRLARRGWAFRLPVLSEDDFVAQARRLCPVPRAPQAREEAPPLPSPSGGGTPLLEARDLRFGYDAPSGKENVLRGVSLTLRRGECLALIGASGSGKTTLIRHLNGLLRPDSGAVLLNGQETSARPLRLRELRRAVGLVFQYPEHQLFGRTVLEDVCMGPLNLGLTRGEAEQAAYESLRLVGLDESCFSRSPWELSGGQRRCAAIAGVLAMEPQALVMDEPAAGLDPRTKRRIFDLVSDIRRQRGLGVILVSHDMEDAARYADRVLALHGGRVALEGAPREVFGRVGDLREMGLDAPCAARLTGRLIAAGLPLPYPAATLDEAERMLVRCGAGNGGEGEWPST